MKILIIMEGFFPGKKYGGPPVSVDNFCTLLDGQECFIITTNHDLGDDEEYHNVQRGWNDRGNCKVMYLNEREFSKNHFDEIIQELQPDMIYLQGLFQRCIFPSLFIAKRNDIAVLIAPRGELCAGAFKKKYKKIPYLLLLKLFGLIDGVHFQSTSSEETQAIEHILKIQKRKIHELTNIPSMTNQKYQRHNKEKGIASFVFLARIHPKKNLISAIKYFMEVKGNASLDIYGPIEDESYWKECQKEISKLPHNISVRYCGLVSHDKVHEIFSKYDAFVFPTFSENYGHVIAESLIVGTPAIISDQTPWTDINYYGAGWALSLSDSGAFTKAIQIVVDSDSRDINNRVLEYIDAKLKIQEIREQYQMALVTIVGE